MKGIPDIAENRHSARYLLFGRRLNKRNKKEEHFKAGGPKKIYAWMAKEVRILHR